MYHSTDDVAGVVTTSNPPRMKNPQTNEPANRKRASTIRESTWTEQWAALEHPDQQ